MEIRRMEMLMPYICNEMTHQHPRLITRHTCAKTRALVAVWNRVSWKMKVDDGIFTPETALSETSPAECLTTVIQNGYAGTAICAVKGARNCTRNYAVTSTTIHKLSALTNRCSTPALVGSRWSTHFPRRRIDPLVTH